MIQVPYRSLSDALDATLQGTVWGVIHFGTNFTEELLERQVEGNAVDKQTILDSRIGVTLDWSSKFLFFWFSDEIKCSLCQFNFSLKLFRRANRVDTTASTDWRFLWIQSEFGDSLRFAASYTQHSRFCKFIHLSNFNRIMKFSIVISFFFSLWNQSMGLENRHLQISWLQALF